MKKTTFFCIALLTCLFFILHSPNVQAQDTKVSIFGIRSDEGRIVLNVFKDNETYDK